MAAGSPEVDDRGLPLPATPGRVLGLEGETRGKARTPTFIRGACSSARDLREVRLVS
ncbi:MAG: hypothetical protein V3U33_02485 [candidate division NC10 bacterium]